MADDLSHAQVDALPLRQARKAQTRATILLAARRLFGAYGYSGVDIRTIAHAAGLSTGAIFASFNGKAELYTAAMGKRAPVGPLADAAEDLRANLALAESFIAGFESERDEYEVAAILKLIREALANAEGAP